MLKVGQQAVVPLKNITRGSTPGTVGITVTAIEPVDRAEFEQMLSSKARGKDKDPYYIRYTVENVGGTDMAAMITPVLKAVGPGGASSTDSVVLMSKVPCVRRRLDAAFAQAGAKLETCRLRVVPKGMPVAGATYDRREGGYRDIPIIWNK